jgi:hypothetical protein
MGAIGHDRRASRDVCSTDSVGSGWAFQSTNAVSTIGAVKAFCSAGFSANAATKPARSVAGQVGGLAADVEPAAAAPVAGDVASQAPTKNASMATRGRVLRSTLSMVTTRAP